jgi:hypothetical protein
MPRGRPDPLRQVPNDGRVHSVPGLEILEKDRTELDESEGRLAPGDDGVYAGTVAIVGADAAVAVTVQRRGVAAGAAIALAGNQIDERLFLGLLHMSLFSVPGKDWLGLGRVRDGLPADPDRSRLRGVFGSIRCESPSAKREKKRSAARSGLFGAIVRGRSR